MSYATWLESDWFYVHTSTEYEKLQQIAPEQTQHYIKTPILFSIEKEKYILTTSNNFKMPFLIK